MPCIQGTFSRRSGTVIGGREPTPALLDAKSCRSSQLRRRDQPPLNGHDGQSRKGGLPGGSWWQGWEIPTSISRPNTQAGGSRCAAQSFSPGALGFATPPLQPDRSELKRLFRRDFFFPNALFARRCNFPSRGTQRSRCPLCQLTPGRMHGNPEESPTWVSSSAICACGVYALLLSDVLP